MLTPTTWQNFGFTRVLKTVNMKKELHRIYTCFKGKEPETFMDLIS